MNLAGPGAVDFAFATVHTVSRGKLQATHPMESLMVLIRASRPVSWAFGPILYAIGLVHSPEGFISVLTKPLVLLQILAVSVPLSFGKIWPALGQRWHQLMMIYQSSSA